ncbi:2-polyprenyl-6-methoxyphenol hydroxylase-like FAD-dependent oxidoreductase [Thermocatellispora tengchongensis]|uniref:2-polyprenyl-6-methoxyphenol hydroxylase-like FAD-dependent oxidoreductase n=1 Tax=Thermocatellispora tengchongensis TaxID=1073253 RepID=A0A840P3X5_9ACTN|nr:FAD-dependent monooxygenase [Thermocatellispora tengchongensis]MBB5133689.1 2-polyprenyl-6-methoxyphenol hydroxylase-like FAD-dependent oxidoreductase [Thermocatellispora tengchongensis]
MHTDVIVVGAGPTGLMLAAELALAGVRVRVLERRESPTRESRALTLHPRSIEIMDLRGIAGRFLSRGRTVPGWHFAGLDTRLDFTALDTRHGYTLFLEQARTEEILEGRVRELGVEIARGREVTAVRQEPDAVVVETAPGEPLRAAYVVGCDGGRSLVRQAAGISFDGSDETLTGMLGDFAATDPDAVRAAEAHGVLAVPLEGGLTRFVVVDPERMRVPAAEPVTFEEFRQALTRIAGTDFGVADPRWLSRFGNATRLAGRYRQGRVLVAGDAAHVHFPAAGQGLNTGLQDAMNLGWKLAAQVKGWAPDGLLDSYDAERRPVGEAVAANTQVQTLLLELTLVPQYRRPVLALREMLDGLLGIEEVNRRLAASVSAIGTRYGDGSPAGSRVPDLALSVTGRPQVERLYPLLHGGRFVLIRTAGHADAGDASAWADRVEQVTASAWQAPPELDGADALLVRPDGHLAWAGRGDEALEALPRWAGAPGATIAEAVR